MTPNIRTAEGSASVENACDGATSGPWGREDDINGHLITAGRDDDGAYIYVADPWWDEDGDFFIVARTALPDALEYITSLESRLQAADELADAAKYFRDGVMATWHKKRVMDLDERNEALRNRLLEYDAVKR